MKMGGSCRATLDSLEQAFVHALRRARNILDHHEHWPAGGAKESVLLRQELDVLATLNSELLRRIRESDAQIAKVTEALRRV